LSPVKRPQRTDYRLFFDVDTRWTDNDRYGHLNNVVYYSLYDTAVNRFLIQQAGLDIHAGDFIAYVVSSACDYHAAAAYPELLEVGLRVDKLGRSSVTYGVAVFHRSEAQALTSGRLTHVFVNRHSERPVPIPAPARAALAAICTDSAASTA
jgi:acyl-CoA thioester hydrolase